MYDDHSGLLGFSDVFVEVPSYGKVGQSLNAVLRASRAKQFLETFFFFILEEVTIPCILASITTYCGSVQIPAPLATDSHKKFRCSLRIKAAWPF